MAKARECKTFTVDSPPGLNVRRFPLKDAQILRVLRDGEKVAVENGADTPDGWKALQGGGYVVEKYLR